MKSEFKVGIIVFLAILSLFTTLFLLKDIGWNEDGQIYIVKFKFLNNLLVGGRIKLHGSIKIGKVINLSHDGENALVYINITDQIVNKMIQTQKVLFSIRADGVLGEKYILVEFDPKNGKNLSLKKSIDGKLTEPPVAVGSESPDLENIMAKLSQLSESFNNIINDDVKAIFSLLKKYMQSESIPKILTNLETASNELNVLLKNGNSIISDVGNNKIPKTLDEVNSTIRSANNEITAVSKSLRNILNSTNNNIQNMFNEQDGLPSLSKEGKSVLQNVNKLVVSLQKVIKNVDNKKHPLGTLIKDKKVARDLKKIIHNLNEITKDLKDNPLINNNRKYQPGPF